MGTSHDRRHILCVPWRPDADELEALLDILSGILRPDERCHIVPRPGHTAGRGQVAPVVPTLVTIEHRLDGPVVALDGQSAERLKARLERAIAVRWPYRRVSVIDVRDVSWRWDDGEDLHELRVSLTDYVDWAWELIERETVASLYGEAAAVDALETGRQAHQYRVAPGQTLSVRHVDGKYTVAPVAKYELTVPGIAYHLRCEAPGEVRRECCIACTQESLETAWLHLVAVARTVETLRLFDQDVVFRLPLPPEMAALRDRPAARLIAVRYEIDPEVYQAHIGEQLGPPFDPIGMVAIAVPGRHRLVPIMCYARSSACRWMVERGMRIEHYAPYTVLEEPDPADVS